VRKRILVAPLDWGLGHATRCIPIIQRLVAEGHQVFIATSGLALPLLKQEFPSLTFFELPSYRARYSRSIPLLVKVLLQTPHFLNVISKEHCMVEALVTEHHINCIISDNRFGCFSRRAKSIFITHQLTILMPTYLKWMQGLINFFNHRMIKKFDACWVPDFPTNRLTGLLSKADTLSIKFIGMLSRFRKSKTPIQKKYDLLVLLSGPEPQRSIFEDIIVQQLQQYSGKFLIVRGLPNEKIKSEEINRVNHLATLELQQAIEASEIVLARSGYTTIMDLYFLEKQAIFVPTPWQTEQEYLADQLLRRKISYCISQKEFDLNTALLKSKSFSGLKLLQNEVLVDDVIDGLL
jgi:predicted glycosyltransferase